MSPLSDSAPVWEALRERIGQSLGLAFDSARGGDLHRGVTALACELGLGDAQACAVHLLSVPWDDHLVRTLASHLTIGESYFFRDPVFMDALASDVLPRLVQQRRAEGRLQLRIWSAGCSTGEEPYSMAMLLRELLYDIDCWNISIEATDINPRFLAKARSGRYGSWSFRGVSAMRLARWFRRAGADRWDVIEQVRGMVRFRELNLATLSHPGMAHATDQIDLLVCRNVLMYFAPPQANDCIDRLAASLASDGRLAVSPTEACGIRSGDLRPAHAGAGLFQRVCASRTPDRIDIGHREPPQPPAVPATALAAGLADTQLRERPSEASQRESIARQAQRAADEGRLDDALRWCDRWLDADPLDAHAYYWRALALLELGRGIEARDALRKCVYIEPRMSVAHLTLGQLARASGRTASAKRHFTAAADLLRAHERDESLPEAGGLTAGRLRESIAFLGEWAA